jgi:hypothetical protein
MMSQPVYLSSPVSYPMISNPAGPATIPAGAWQGPGTPTVSAPSSARSAWAPQATTPRPIFRAKGPDDSPVPSIQTASRIPAPISIPTPEQLGVASAANLASDNLDWTAAHRQLEKLGAVCFRMDKLDAGVCQFTCLLATRQPGVTHRVEASAPSTAEAARLVLHQAEEWAHQSK